MTEENRHFHIVIADDDHDDQFLFNQALAELKINYKATQLYSGYQLMDLLLKKPQYAHLPEPDLVFLDINMPSMSGIVVLKEIAKYPHLKNIPVYILSTSSSALDRKLTFELGAAGFYTKPVEFQQLKKIVCDITAKELHY